MEKDKRLENLNVDEKSLDAILEARMKMAGVAAQNVSENKIKEKEKPYKPDIMVAKYFK
jgi:hypothetical protein